MIRKRKLEYFMSAEGTGKLKGKVHRPAMLYVMDTVALKKKNVAIMEVEKIKMLWRMCSVILKKRSSEG